MLRKQNKINKRLKMFVEVIFVVADDINVWIQGI